MQPEERLGNDVTVTKEGDTYAFRADGIYLFYETEFPQELLERLLIGNGCNSLRARAIANKWGELYGELQLGPPTTGKNKKGKGDDPSETAS